MKSLSVGLALNSPFRTRFLFAMALLVHAAFGSPIEVVIETKPQLEAIGAKISFESGEGLGENRSKEIHIRVNWSPKIEDKVFEPRMDFILDAKDNPLGALGSKLHFRFPISNNGKVIADFTIAEEELGRAWLVFRNGQQWVHLLDLKSLVAGFPPLQDQDPFEE